MDTGKHKYQRLKEYIIETVESRKLEPGEKIESENELADKFEISRHTVRQAIGELESDGLLYRVQGKGTFVAGKAEMQTGQASTVGILTTFLNDYIFPSIIMGADRILSQNGYNIMLGCTCNQHDKERLCLENLMKQNITGLIAEPTRSALPNPNLDLYSELSRKGVQILFIHGCYRDTGYSYIVEDDVLAGYLATKHLVELGHTRIGGVFKVDDIQGHYRYEGYRKAHIEAGLEVSDSSILWFDTGEADNKFGNSRSDRLASLLSENSAVVCYNDQIAVQVMDPIRERGLAIPDDISIVSFDDSQLAVASEIKLTTVAHPKEKLGEEAAEAIMNMITGRKHRYSMKIEPELIIRGSTGKPGK